MESTLTATGGTVGTGGAEDDAPTPTTGGVGNSGTVDGPDAGLATIVVTGGNAPLNATAQYSNVGSGNTGTITGGKGINVITAARGPVGPAGNGVGNAKGATIDGNVVTDGATESTCNTVGGNPGTVVNCTTESHLP
ncbi:hypothetical protein [Streptomyces sp. NPDC051554]|uniref:hypothetical protein n=1 Tax=Streptomyces sp. NPDC051554 TaxID=3365656 RepID=UPI0037A4063D